MNGKNILLIIGGGIAAYKSLDLIRRLKERGSNVRTILTEGGSHFVTPLSLAALTGEKVYADMFDMKDEARIGHIALSREADLIVVAPATADLMAKMASGLAGDLASAVLLAADKKALLAPSMNALMWKNPATMRNVETLRRDGIMFVGPDAGDLACGEIGTGRMSEPEDILAAIAARLRPAPLAGVSALVTAGPTHEAIDPVRYIANRSSGKQGYAIAESLAASGAAVTLISGPTALKTPPGVKRIEIVSAEEMLKAAQAALPVDVALFAAAVADWRPADPSTDKLKKQNGPPAFRLAENPDILATVAKGSPRPKLVIGFAAETENLETAAAGKRQRKGCDWLLANDVSNGAVFDADDNQIHFVTAGGSELWPKMTKRAVADALAARIAAALAES